MSNPTTPIVVAGDALIDWFESTTGSKQSRMDARKEVPNWKTYPRKRQWAKPGGALLLTEFLRKASGGDVIGYAVRGINRIPSDRIVRSFARLDRFPFSNRKEDKDNMVQRIQEYNGFDGPEKGTPPLVLSNDDPSADLVLLDDSNNGFRDNESSWPKAIQGDNRPTVIYKMSWPFAQGRLWDRLQSRLSDRLIAIVGADDLRLEGAHISRCLSWERTVQDFLWQYRYHQSLAPLKKCAFLIVRFGVEGAILVSNRKDKGNVHLFYDPEIGEDGFGGLHQGFMPGIGCAFTAALAAQIAEFDEASIRAGVRRGLLCGRELWKTGFIEKSGGLEYPLKVFSPSHSMIDPLQEVPVPDTVGGSDSQGEYWSLLNEMAAAGLEQAAMYYVQYGKDPVVNRVPMAKYRNLQAVDRSEIEGYRSIYNLIQEYLGLPKKQPLAIAVFGAPGSGKSFGVTEIAESISPGKVQKVEFNLSQFTSVQDLIGAFHKIRDVVLGGAVPLVFFDEFDSDFNGELGWLKYFLSPIQDGSFREGEAVHPIGKAIFIFAGGTCNTFEQFAQLQCEKKSSENGLAAESVDDSFKGVKGPDFVSRLRGFINIKGPNPLDDKDVFYIVRRALLLRSQFTKQAGHLMDSRKKLAIDSGVLRALLKVPHYKHGVRSMSALLEMSMLAGRKCFEPSALPSRNQLKLHVDADAFYDLMLRDTLLSSQTEKIAKAIHEQYLNDQKNRKPATDPSMQPWESLDEGLKDYNRAAASDIPNKLEAIGYDYIPDQGKPVPVKFSGEQIEKLAEMEHDRWNREKSAAGWTLGPVRDLKKKTTPYLVPWNILPDDIKEWDREAVRNIPQAMAYAGFKVEKRK
jgi:hypothetical protein